jgi:Lon protease-like protein
MTLLERLPLFPLNTVLFPQGRLPLQIFEVRYLHMVSECRRQQAGFGVVSLVAGSEVRKARAEADALEAFQPLGTLARIVEHAAPMPGLMRIECVGEHRFRVLRKERLTQGLWVADVELVEADQLLDVPPHIAHTAEKLGRLIRALQDRGVPAAQMPLRPPYQLHDCAWAANRWCVTLPLSADVKQQLLALDSPILRLELVGDLRDRTELSF